MTYLQNNAAFVQQFNDQADSAIKARPENGEFSHRAGHVTPARNPRKHCVSSRCTVAQLDRALPSEGRGHTFESCRVRQQH